MWTLIKGSYPKNKNSDYKQTDEKDIKLSRFGHYYLRLKKSYNQPGFVKMLYYRHDRWNFSLSYYLYNLIIFSIIPLIISLIILAGNHDTSIFKQVFEYAMPIGAVLCIIPTLVFGKIDVRHPQDHPSNDYNVENNKHSKDLYNAKKNDDDIKYYEDNKHTDTHRDAYLTISL